MEEVLPELAYCGALGDIQPVDGDRFALLAICSGTGGQPVDAKRLWIGLTGGPGFVEVEPSLNHVDEAWLGVVEDGFWIFWRRDFAAGRIWARRLDRQLQPVGDPALVLDLGGSVGLARFHIVPVGRGGVAFAWKGTRVSEESSLGISVLDGDGRMSAAVTIFEDAVDARSASFSLSRQRNRLLVAWIVESRDRSTLRVKELTVGLEQVAGEAELTRSIDRGYLRSVRLSPFGTGGVLGFLEPSFSGGHDLRIVAVPDDVSEGLNPGCRIGEGLPTLEHWLLSGPGGTVSVARTEPSANAGGWLGYRTRLEDLLASDCRTPELGSPVRP